MSKMYLSSCDYVASDVALKPDSTVFLCCDPTDICLEVSSPGRRLFMSFTSYTQWLSFFFFFLKRKSTGSSKCPVVLQANGLWKRKS